MRREDAKARAESEDRVGSDEDEAFIAEVPELPGCAADGETYEEALANVQVIIEEWIETAKDLGRPIPQPRGRLMFA
jgi:predicted RNase H-like HicB family nuclease